MSKLDHLDLRASASIGGVITNRVSVSKRKPPKPRAFKADATAKGRTYTVICVSVPTAILEAIDAAAAAVGVCRSEYLRIAAIHFHAYGLGSKEGKR